MKALSQEVTKVFVGPLSRYCMSVILSAQPQPSILQEAFPQAPEADFQENRFITVRDTEPSFSDETSDAPTTETETETDGDGSGTASRMDRKASLNIQKFLSKKGYDSTSGEGGFV